MDSYTTVTTKWYGSRIMDSIKWIFFWLILFIASFFVLWMNEATVDMSEIAKTSVEVSPEKYDSNFDWKFVSVTWEIKTDEKIWDDLYLKPGNYISLSRKVEMYSWVETEKSDTDTNMWGSQTTTTTYEYSKEWVEYPENSNDFQVSDGHHNPEKYLDSIQKRVVNSKVWIYDLDTSSISLASESQINLNKDIIILPENDLTNKNSSLETLSWTTSTWVTLTWTISTWTITPDSISWISLVNWYLFEWKWKLSNPLVWDIRVSYTALKNWAGVTVMWKQNWEKLESYTDKDWNRLYRVFHWSRDDAISTLRTEYLFKLWWVRALWFILMWIGLALLLWPISVVLDVLPILWSLGRGIIGIITFIIALVLSVITILISIVFHNIYMLIIVIIIAWFFWYKFIKNKAKKLDKTKIKEKK